VQFRLKIRRSKNFISFEGLNIRKFVEKSRGLKYDGLGRGKAKKTSTFHHRPALQWNGAYVRPSYRGFHQRFAASERSEFNRGALCLNIDIYIFMGVTLLSLRDGSPHFFILFP